MAVYPTDLDHPRVHMVFARTLTLGTGKVVLVGAYKTYPAMPGEGGVPRNKVIAGVTVSTYESTGSTNYTGAILQEQTYAHSNMADAEVRAVQWLQGLREEYDAARGAK